MDRIKKYKNIIKETFEAHKGLPSRTFPNLQDMVVIDAEEKHFIFFTVGWDRGQYHHSTVYHLEVKGSGKIWVHALNADDRLEEDLLEKGIAKEDIIGGMLTPYVLEQSAEGKKVEA